MWTGALAMISRSAAFAVHRLHHLGRLGSLVGCDSPTRKYGYQDNRMVVNVVSTLNDGGGDRRWRQRRCPRRRRKGAGCGHLGYWRQRQAPLDSVGGLKLSHHCLPWFKEDERVLEDVLDGSKRLMPMKTHSSSLFQRTALRVFSGGLQMMKKGRFSLKIRKVWERLCVKTAWLARRW